MNRYAILSICIAMLLKLTGCTTSDLMKTCEEDDRCLIYGISADIPILDPHISAAPEAGMIFRQIYDTLVYRDSATKEFRPGLADSWETSLDGLHYTFNLRQDIFFHDGTPFNARAVSVNINRILDTQTNSLRARSLLGPYSHYEVADAYTIHLYFSAPFAPFLDSLSQPYFGIASPQALNAYDRLRYQFHQIGTGPFELEKYLPGDHIELRRNPQYRPFASNYEPLTGNEIERVVFEILSNQDVKSDALLDTTIDVIDDLAPRDAISLAANSRVQLYPIEIPGQSTQFMFNTLSQHLSVADVRRALVYGTNRFEIVNKIYFNYSPVAWAPLSQSTSYAHTGYINEFAFDLGLAQELLALSGYSDTNGDGILDRDGLPLELSVLVPPWGEWPDVAAYLREQWQRIGIRLIVEPVPGTGRLITEVLSGKHDLVAIDSYGIDPAILGNIFFDNSIYAHSRAENAQLGNLLLTAVQEQDPLARRTQYYDIQALLMANSLLLPIRENVRLRVARSDILGLSFDPFGYYPLLYNVSIRGS